VIEKQLEWMDRASAVVSGTRGANSLKGRKVPPKDRGASGETWAGRGGEAQMACCCDEEWKEA